MTFTGGNKAIRDHVFNGKDLLLFESLGKGKGYRFQGTFCSTSWEYRTDEDMEGAERQVIVFHLLPISDFQEIDPLDVTGKFDDLRKKAYESSTESAQHSESTAKRIAYERSKAVKDYVLTRANGICECCDQSAPFIRRNRTPYLEPHHMRRVSDGGPDHPRWVAGICPNCHREVHSGIEGDTLNQKLIELIGKKEEGI